VIGQTRDIDRALDELSSAIQVVESRMPLRSSEFMSIARKNFLTPAK
jgi:hypothetical protein